VSTCHTRKAGRKRCWDEISGRDDESCDIMRHHATSCDRERKRVGSGWRKTSFDRRHCGRETRWRERKRRTDRSRKRKTGGSRKRKGFPLQFRSVPMGHSKVLRISVAKVPQMALLNMEHSYILRELISTTVGRLLCPSGIGLARLMRCMNQQS